MVGTAMGGTRCNSRLYGLGLCCMPLRWYHGTVAVVARTPRKHVRACGGSISAVATCGCLLRVA